MKSRFTVVMLMAAALSGCGNTADNRSLLDARTAYTRASTDPVVAERAPLELAAAERALHEAERLRRRAMSADRVSEQAYKAAQLARLAESAAHRREGRDLRMAGDY